MISALRVPAVVGEANTKSLQDKGEVSSCKGATVKQNRWWKIILDLRSAWVFGESERYEVRGKVLIGVGEKSLFPAEGKTSAKVQGQEKMYVWLEELHNKGQKCKY